MKTITITQYLRPDGHTRPMEVELDDDHAEKAKGLILSAEVLTTGEVAIYARKEDDPEEMELMELATNGPGEENPTAMLCKVIDRVHDGG